LRSLIMSNSSTGFNLLFGQEGQNYQIISVSSTEKVVHLLEEMGVYKGNNLSLIKITEEQEAVVMVNYQQITLTPKLLNAIKVIEANNLLHHQCGNCGHGCGRHG
jgi:Fe2+ transport system protein FeoA